MELVAPFLLQQLFSHQQPGSMQPCISRVYVDVKPACSFRYLQLAQVARDEYLSVFFAEGSHCRGYSKGKLLPLQNLRWGAARISNLVKNILREIAVFFPRCNQVLGVPAIPAQAL